MRTRNLTQATLAALALAAVSVAQQPAMQTPLASNPVVELKGKIERVQVAPGQGMPYMEITEGGRTTKVFLGSMRYLMQNNFSPKAGEEVEVKGYRMAENVIASSVSLLAQNKTLKLRDDSGRPLWMGGRHGQRGTSGGPGRGRRGGRRAPANP